MKISWGIKIFTLYGVFVLFVLALVIFTMTKDVGLVTENYYEKELSHQEHIDKLKRTEALEEGLKITMAENTVNFTFPRLATPEQFDGVIYLYRPSNNLLDKTFSFSLDTSYVHVLPASNFAKGLWKIKVVWNVGENSYFNEKIIMVN